MLKSFAQKQLADFIRRQAGTPSVFDGIRRLAAAGFGERSILPGILLNTVTTPGKKRTEQEVESVIDTLQGKGLGDGGQLYPSVNIDYYRRATDYQHTQRYWRPGDRESQIFEDPGDRRFLPATPFKPVSPNPSLPPKSRATAAQPPIVPGGVRGVSSRPPVSPPGIAGTPPPPISGEWSNGWSEPKRVESSHIYSIAYNEVSNQCAVTFRLPSEGLTVVGAVPSLCSGEYSSWTRRNSVPSVTYVYGNASKPFPKSLYDSFKEAPSKGRFLWENIRGCGDPIYPYTTFDIDVDGAIFLPSYDSMRDNSGGVGNEPSAPPRR